MVSFLAVDENEYWSSHWSRGFGKEEGVLRRSAEYQFKVGTWYWAVGSGYIGVEYSQNTWGHQSSTVPGWAQWFEAYGWEDKSRFGEGSSCFDSNEEEYQWKTK